jgi:hypothetical protein
VSTSIFGGFLSSSVGSGSSSAVKTSEAVISVSNSANSDFYGFYLPLIIALIIVLCLLMILGLSIEHP